MNECETHEFSTEELKISTYEIDMILLENQIKDNKMRKQSKLARWLRKIFKLNQ